MPFKNPEDDLAWRRKHRSKKAEPIEQRTRRLAYQAKYAKQWYAAHPEAKFRIQRKAQLKRIGWTPEQYDSVFNEQSGLCAICQRPAEADSNNVKGLLCADHEHITPPVPRGLLCSRCNKALGMFRESVEILLAAIEYVKKWSCNASVVELADTLGREPSG